MLNSTPCNTEKFRHNKGQIKQFVFIGLPTLGSRCFQRNFSRTLSKFTLDNLNSSLLFWCHPFSESKANYCLTNRRLSGVKWLKNCRYGVKHYSIYQEQCVFVIYVPVLHTYQMFSGIYNPRDREKQARYFLSSCCPIASGLVRIISSLLKSIVCEMFRLCLFFGDFILCRGYLYYMYFHDVYFHSLSIMLLIMEILYVRMSGWNIYIYS